MFLYSKKRNTRKKYQTQGFSLIELMVSLTIFSILMVVSVGTLLTLIDANAKAQALSSATTNLSFALDSITRQIRTGHYYNCEENPGQPGLPGNAGVLAPRDCISKDSVTFIRDRDGYKIGYRKQGTVIEQQIEKPDGSTNGWEAVTSDDVEIEQFLITVENSPVYGVNGNGAGAQDQPVVTLHIQGKVTKNNGLENKTDFNIQTLIVQRRLDQV